MFEIPSSQKIDFLSNAASIGLDLADMAGRGVALSQCRVFFDFDNTISKIDVLDDLIERFSIDRKWRLLEQEWQAGKIGSEECLHGQLRSVRVTRHELVDYLSEIDIDPYFHRILVLLKSAGVRPIVVSDSFNFLIETILKSNDVHGVKILANRLRIHEDRLTPVFPYRNQACLRCGNCKTSHLRNEDSFGKVLVYVGDGLSDCCASLQAHLVFAKDTLAGHLRDKEKKFIWFKNLRDVYDGLKGLSHG
ncbi:MAG: MtnX-like HAD-IB family phosphatase [Candidatus Omnitrophica bacterium]|nr:MtnX-like HAD-IB family phosphatase [Candidatus Omnitrophota bacterium]